MKSEFYKILDEYIPNPKCELNYKKDYELLLATILSAQCTDKRVNEVTKRLFMYNLEEISKMTKFDLENIIKSCGSYTKKADYLLSVSKRLIEEYNGEVPNNRLFLESLPGVGRKTTNVVLKNLFNEPCIAVDTHVDRISKRLGLAKINDNVLSVEKKLMKKIPKDKWNRVGEQLLLFGRYYCTSKNPKCLNCLFYNYCKEKNKTV